MKILYIGKEGTSLTGAGTYDNLLYCELSKRHDVTLYEQVLDLDQEWDIAHCSDLKHLTFKVARHLRCPLVVDIHDYYWIRYFHFLCLDFPLRFLIQRYRKIKYRLLFRHIDGIILHGRYLYDRIDHPSKYLNFYFGLEHHAVSDRDWDNRENLLLFVGGDFFRKGLPRLLRALPLVLTRVPDAKLVVIGTDAFYARLFATWLSRGLPVEFIYGMPRESVYELYSRAKALVLPSEIEATPLVISEALIAGIPPVISDVGGHPELVIDGQTGYLFKVDDTALLAQRLITCLTDRNVSEQLVKQGRDFFQPFTISKMMGQLESVFSSVISKAGTRE